MENSQEVVEKPKADAISIRQKFFDIIRRNFPGRQAKPERPPQENTGWTHTEGTPVEVKPDASASISVQDGDFRVADGNVVVKDAANVSVQSDQAEGGEAPLGIVGKVDELDLGGNTRVSVQDEEGKKVQNAPVWEHVDTLNVTGDNNRVGAEPFPEGTHSMEEMKDAEANRGQREQSHRTDGSISPATTLKANLEKAQEAIKS